MSKAGYPINHDPNREVETSGSAALLAALDELASRLHAAQFPLALPDAADCGKEAHDIAEQIRDYLIPRLERIDAPLVAVIGGSTGAGKSTLTNSLLGEVISRASAVRPTTRRPLLVCHPSDLPWFADDRILPSLARVHRAGDRAAEQALAGSAGRASGAHAESADAITEIEIATSDRLPQGLAIIDAPDIDSVVSANRELASALLAAADLWLFVTTAARYADAVPWQLLHEAAARNVVCAIILDRVPPGAASEIRPDLARRLDEAGLSRSPLFTIGERPLSEEGLLPDADVAPVRGWLEGLAHDAASRAAVARTTLIGALDATLARLTIISQGIAGQGSAVGHLKNIRDREMNQGLENISAAVRDGAIMRDEVLARWQDLVGTGEFTRALESRISRLRDSITRFFTGKTGAEVKAQEAIGSTLSRLLSAQAREAVGATLSQWSHAPGGPQVASQAEGELIPLAEVDAAAEELTDAWQRALVANLSAQMDDKRQTARILSLGVNALGVALMVVIFASTAGLTGTEVAVAGGTAVVAQKVLEAVFGDDAVRRMAADAREDLLERAGVFIGQVAAPLTGALDQTWDEEQAAGLMNAIERLGYERNREAI